MLGQTAEADKSFAAALDLMTSIKQDRSAAAATMLNNWGIAVLNAGDVGRARALWQRGFDAVVARDASTPPPSYLYLNLGRANEQTGRFDDAVALYTKAIEITRARGDRVARPTDTTAWPP